MLIGGTYELVWEGMKKKRKKVFFRESRISFEQKQHEQCLRVKL